MAVVNYSTASVNKKKNCSENLSYFSSTRVLKPRHEEEPLTRERGKKLIAVPFLVTYYLALN